MSDYHDFVDERMERLRDYVPLEYLVAADPELLRVAQEEARKRGLSPLDNQAQEPVPVKPRNLPTPL